MPISNGQVQETGDFELDGVTFPAAEVRLDFMQPVDTEKTLFDRQRGRYRAGPWSR